MVHENNSYLQLETKDSEFIDIFFFQFQIHFHGKDMSSLHRHFDVDCLPSNYGGKVDIPEGTGVALGDLFRLYSKEFESMHKILHSQLLIFHFSTYSYYLHLTLTIILFFFLKFQWQIHLAMIHQLVIHCKHSMTS